MPHGQPDKPESVWLTPGSLIAQDADGGYFGAVTLWSMWLTIAVRAAAAAVEGEREYELAAQAPPASASVWQSRPGELHRVEERPGAEVPYPQHALVAITAAAFAVDGFYGSVRDVIAVPASSGKRRPSRSAVVMECLRQGFELAPDLDRLRRGVVELYKSRDRLVHHAERLRPLELIAEGPAIDLVGPVELSWLTAAAADTAVDTAVDVVERCLSSPTKRTSSWVGTRGSTLAHVRELSGRRERPRA